MAHGAPKLGENTLAKLERAQHHLVELAEEQDAFLKRDPYSFSEERDADGARLVRIHIREEPPLKFGVILGDWLHNLHSALDNLVPDIIRASGRVPSRRATFPIYDNERGFCAHINNRLKAMRASDVERLKAFQPYSGGSGVYGEALGLLNAYSNGDKHAAIHPAFGLVVADPNVFIVQGTNAATLDIEIIDPGKALEDGAPVLRMRVLWGAPFDTPEQIDVQVPIAITFGERALFSHRLPELGAIIRSIATSFTREFPT